MLKTSKFVDAGQRRTCRNGEISVRLHDFAFVEFGVQRGFFLLVRFEEI